MVIPEFRIQYSDWLLFAKTASQVLLPTNQNIECKILGNQPNRLSQDFMLHLRMIKISGSSTFTQIYPKVFLYVKNSITVIEGYALYNYCNRAIYECNTNTEWEINKIIILPGTMYMNSVIYAYTVGCGQLNHRIYRINQSCQLYCILH